MISLHETCEQYVARRLSEGWRIISQDGFNVILQSPKGIIRPVDLRNDVETLRPNAAGDETSITSQYPADGEHWDKVDEVDADEDSTYVQFTPSSSGDRQYARDLFNLPGSDGSGTINNITVYIRTKSQYVNTYSYSFVSLKTEATVYDYEKTTNSYYILQSQELTVNPKTGLAWTWEQIDALQIGVKLAGGASQWSRCTQVYVEVDYTAVVLHELTVTDGIALTDTLIKMPMKFVSDGIALSDVLIKNPIKTLVDGIAFTDVWEGYKLRVFEFLDGIAFTDTLFKSTAKVMSDGIKLTDTLLKTTSKVLTDGIKLTDTVRKDIAKTLTDGIAFTDIVTRFFEQVFTDGIAFTDSLVVMWVRKLKRLLYAVRNLLSERELPS